MYGRQAAGLETARELESSGPAIERALGEDDGQIPAWTDYGPARDAIVASPRFRLADSPSEAACWYRVSHIRDYYREVPAGVRVNQFPYESCLVQKDLMPQTVRRWCGGTPRWFPETYDLATESPHFLAACAPRMVSERGMAILQRMWNHEPGLVAHVLTYVAPGTTEARMAVSGALNDASSKLWIVKPAALIPLP